mgnify:CR=1 FL=1
MLNKEDFPLMLPHVLICPTQLHNEIQVALCRHHKLSLMSLLSLRILCGIIWFGFGLYLCEGDTLWHLYNLSIYTKDIYLVLFA